MHTTLKDLAAELLLSPATVSMALRNSPLVAQKTRAKVNRLAAERGYIRNDVGVALKMRRTQLIGFLIPGVIRSFYNEVLQGAGEAAVKAGYGLLLGWASTEKETADQLRLMLEKNIDALIVADKHLSMNPMLSRFIERKKPVVFCTGSAPAHCSSVRNDDFLGGRLALEVMAKKGHKTLLSSTLYSARYEGNCAAAASSGITLYPYQYIEEAEELYRQHRDITGIICYSDDEAIKLMRLYRSKGIRIPEELSLIGFDDLPIAALPEYSLTTIAQQRSRLGAEAVKLAVRLALSSNKTVTQEIVLEPKPVIRNTVAAPKQSVSSE